MNFHSQNRRNPRSGFGSRRPRRRSPRGRRGGNFARPLALIGGAVFCGAALVGGVYVAMQDANLAKPDEMGCYPQRTGQAQTFALVDSSDPAWDTVQSRDLVNAFTIEFQQRLGFNERFSIATTQQRTIGSIPDPVVSLCGPATSSAELENVGAAGTTTAFITRQSEKLFAEVLKPKLDEVFSTDAAGDDRQSRGSPILEQIQSISRDVNFSDAGGERKLILVSDLIQATPEIQFCQTQGHLPSFDKFKARSDYYRLAPNSLNGVQVQIYMLLRNGLGSAPYAYCNEDELRSFWQAYFEDSGARSVNFTRIRPGG